MPNYFDNNDGFNFQYCKRTQVIQAQFTEKYSLTKEKVPNIAQEQDTDDYCPPVELKNLIESCGRPKLSFQQISNSDCSTTYLPVDANDTETKIMAKIDDLVEEYTGKDLRNTVLSDVNHYLSNSIEEVNKCVKQDKKAECLSLKVNNIDWEEMELSGKFEKEYVAQLDMCLSEVVEMSAKDIIAKGFNADKKIAFLRKHVLRKCGNLDQSYADVTSNKSLRTVGGIDPSNHFNQISNGTSKYYPMGWKIFSTDGQNAELVNTCPIDNYLMMFDCLYQGRNVEIHQLPVSLPNVLQQIHKLLVDKEFGKESIGIWITYQIHLSLPMGKFDVFGNGNQMVITGLAKVLSNTVASTCSAPNCPLAVKSVKTYSIELGFLPRRMNYSPQS